MKKDKLLLVLGISMSIVVTIITYNSNHSFAQNIDARYQVIDCTILGNSTFQKSGPCPDVGAEPSQGNVESRTNNKLGNSLESGITPPSNSPSNPFAAIS